MNQSGQSRAPRKVKQCRDVTKNNVHVRKVHVCHPSRRRGHWKRGICTELSENYQIATNLRHSRAASSDLRNEVHAILRRFGTQFATDLHNDPLANAPFSKLLHYRNSLRIHVPTTHTTHTRIIFCFRSVFVIMSALKN